MATSKPYVFVRKNGPFVEYNWADPEMKTAVNAQILNSAIEFLTENVEGWQPPTPPVPEEAVAATPTVTATPPPPTDTLTRKPTDPRLVYISSSDTNKDILSFSADAAEPLVDGFVFPTDPGDATGNSPKLAAQDIADINKYQGVDTFSGVPALMNPNAYIGFQQFKGGKTRDYLSTLIDQENQSRWYEVNLENAAKVHRYKAPSVSEIVAWSQEEGNADKTPYRFQDFAYCKYWQKVPNNYLITLRRYPFPTSDNLQAAGENHSANPDKIDMKKLRPVATAVTWLGETTGNKISSVVGPIESGLNWKDIKSEMNTVSPASPGDAGDGPMPGLAKFVGLISGDAQGGDAKKGQQGAPPDPYTSGPWNNKVIGSLNVIDSVKARERGLKFEHKISLVFEYSARSIGGINTKAAMLDIMSNLLLLTSATASFWGGANRFSPGSPGNTAPFLGGPSGRAAFMRGDPLGFLDAVTSQFSTAASAISDFLFSASQNPIEALKGLAAGGAKAFMNEKNGSRGGFVSGLKAILTGEPVGEWHVTVGNPFNPMMMIGNLICTGVKIEFNDELGPDDFPTELKATITLEHGMPRDRDAIESMFNGGGGRLYSLPADYEKSFSSSSVTAVDKYTGGGVAKGEGGAGSGGARKPGGKFGRNKSVLFGDPQDVDRAINNSTNTASKTYSTIAAKWGLGWTKSTDIPPPKAATTTATTTTTT